MLVVVVVAVSLPAVTLSVRARLCSTRSAEPVKCVECAEKSIVFEAGFAAGVPSLPNGTNGVNGTNGANGPFEIPPSSYPIAIVVGVPTVAVAVTISIAVAAAVAAVAVVVVVAVLVVAATVAVGTAGAAFPDIASSSSPLLPSTPATPSGAPRRAVGATVADGGEGGRARFSSRCRVALLPHAWGLPRLLRTARAAAAAAVDVPAPVVVASIAFSLSPSSSIPCIGSGDDPDPPPLPPLPLPPPLLPLPLLLPLPPPLLPTPFFFLLAEEWREPSLIGLIGVPLLSLCLSDSTGRRSPLPEPWVEPWVEPWLSASFLFPEEWEQAARSLATRAKYVVQNS